MTQELTRQLGIEFERRIQIMYPEAKFTDKLTSDIIYSMLSEFLTKYVKALYLALSTVESGTLAAAKINDVLNSLIKTELIYLSSTYDSEQCEIYELPDNYFEYVRSFTTCTISYKNNDISRVSNIVIKPEDAKSILATSFDKNRIIRNPKIYIENGKFYLLHDIYTDVEEVYLTYIRLPYAFNIMKFDNNDMAPGAVHSTCELPFICFDELVDGAINLYMMTYKFGLSIEANKRKQKAKEEQPKETEQ